MRTGMTGSALAAFAAACSGGTADVQAGQGKQDERNGTMTADRPDEGAPARELPYAHGRSFSTLDEYLAHLRQYAGPVGQPWYREIRPGVYELVTTVVPRGEPEIYTRAELMERYGFTR